MDNWKFGPEHDHLRDENGMIHWTKNPNTPHVVFYPEEEYPWRKKHYEGFVPRVDDRQEWQARITQGGYAATQAGRDSGGAGIYVAAYSREQFGYIRWAVWARESDGWTIAEIWRVLRHVWELLPGQTPFVSRTITSWFATRKKYRKRGIEWP